METWDHIFGYNFYPPILAGLFPTLTQPCVATHARLHFMQTKFVAHTLYLSKWLGINTCGRHGSPDHDTHESKWELITIGIYKTGQQSFYLAEEAKAIKRGRERLGSRTPVSWLLGLFQRHTWGLHRQDAPAGRQEMGIRRTESPRNQHTHTYHWKRTHIHIHTQSK